MADKRIPCADAAALLRFLPYSDRLPYKTGRSSGRFEECFASEQDARARFRQLRQERRIEDAEIHVARPGQRRGSLVLEWQDRVPRKWYKRRR